MTTGVHVQVSERIDWRAVAAATGPADRDSARQAVLAAYQRAGLAAPERVVWVRSPLEAVRLLRTATGTGPSVREALRNAPLAAERARLHAELGPTGFSEHWRATGSDLWEVTGTVVDRIRTAVVDSVGDRADRTAVRLLLLDAVLGQHDAAWFTAFDTEPGAPLHELSVAARDAGWWWPYANIVVLSERPTDLHRDEAGRLDRGDGPALAYADGFALFAWRGTPVPDDFHTVLRDLTAERIRGEENAELRRVMLEYYGYDRYLEESDARPIHRDETGILWRIALDGDEDVVMVEVVNSTPEPDGTSRTYWLRVPPSTRTARAGVAWTFGLEAQEYQPLQQT